MKFTVDLDDPNNGDAPVIWCDFNARDEYGDVRMVKGSLPGISKAKEQSRRTGPARHVWLTDDELLVPGVARWEGGEITSVRPLLELLLQIEPDAEIAEVPR